MFARTPQCQAVLKQYGLQQSSMAVIGADKPVGSTEWRIMVSGGVEPDYLDVQTARRLAAELARLGEMMLSARLSSAAETAQRLTRSPGT